MTDESRWQDGLRLDDGPGPAAPIAAEHADQLVERAVQALDRPRSTGGARWTWAAAAAVALVVAAPAAVGAFQAYVWPALRARPAPASRRVVPPPVVDAGLSPEPPPAEPPAAEPATKAPPPKKKAVRRSPIPSPPIVAPRRPAPTAEALLATANRRRAARAFGQAADVYAEVRRRYPNSGAAYVAAVAEGQLRLTTLDQPRTALTAFRAARAARPGGPLDAEARFGEGAALVALDRPDQARRVWRALLEQHPNSAPARRAEARLQRMDARP